MASEYGGAILSTIQVKTDLERGMTKVGIVIAEELNTGEVPAASALQRIEGYCPVKGAALELKVLIERGERETNPYVMKRGKSKQPAACALKGVEVGWSTKGS